MKRFLLSLGGLIYVPGLPHDMLLAAPDPGTRLKITDVPLVTGREYDQFEYVSREAAVMLSTKYPDCWQLAV